MADTNKLSALSKNRVKNIVFCSVVTSDNTSDLYREGTQFKTLSETLYRRWSLWYPQIWHRS